MSNKTTAQMCNQIGEDTYKSVMMTEPLWKHDKVIYDQAEQRTRIEIAIKLLRMDEFIGKQILLQVLDGDVETLDELKNVEKVNPLGYTE